jgi:hypothetical protein
MSEQINAAKQKPMVSKALITALIVVVGALAAVVHFDPSPARTSSAGPSTPALAGTLVNFVRYCPNEFYALAPRYQDAVVAYVQLEQREFGADAVAQATAAGYRDGYYQLGDRWCTHVAASTARSIAYAMTRNDR